MVVENIDIIKPHAFQALVEGGDQILARTVAVTVRTVPHLVSGFGRDAEFIAELTHSPVKNTTEIFLRTAIVRAAIIVGKVKVCDTKVESCVYHLLHNGKISFVAKILPQTKGDSGEF